MICSYVYTSHRTVWNRFNEYCNTRVEYCNTTYRYCLLAIPNCFNVILKLSVAILGEVIPFFWPVVYVYKIFMYIDNAPLFTSTTVPYHFRLCDIYFNLNIYYVFQKSKGKVPLKHGSEITSIQQKKSRTSGENHFYYACGKLWRRQT